MTNGDRIRQMSNEELAEFLQKVEKGEGNISCENCGYDGTHHSKPNDEQYKCEGCYWLDIGHDIKKWLDKEEEKTLTWLEKWKQEAIKNIEEMSIDDVIECILERDKGCDYCDIKKSYVNVKGFCEEDCEECIKAYLESECE